MTDAYARSSDPETSRAAAESVRPTRLEALVLDALRMSPSGATSFELAEFLNLSLVTVSPRLRPLADKGLVVAAGTRPGDNGRPRTIWRLKPPPTGQLALL